MHISFDEFVGCMDTPGKLALFKTISDRESNAAAYRQEAAEQDAFVAEDHG